VSNTITESLVFVESAREVVMALPAHTSRA